MSEVFNICAALTFLLTIVSSYDFRSKDFNQYLAEEIDYYSQVDLPLPAIRFKRDDEAASLDKCRFKRKRLCCAETSIEDLHENEREIKRECFKQVLGKDKEPKSLDPFKCENVEQHKRDMICVMQCVGQKNDVLDEHGMVKEAAFTEFVKQSFSKESWFGDLQDTIIETCIKDAKNATQNNDLLKKGTCNPAGIKLAHCLFVQTQLRCPDSAVKDMKTCSKLRERIKSKISENGPAPPPFLHEE